MGFNGLERMLRVVFAFYVCSVFFFFFSLRTNGSYRLLPLVVGFFFFFSLRFVLGRILIRPMASVLKTYSVVLERNAQPRMSLCQVLLLSTQVGIH